MIAVIAEKPSLARNIVAGIGEMQKKNGYFENGHSGICSLFATSRTIPFPKARPRGKRTEKRKKYAGRWTIFPVFRTNSALN